MNDRYQDCYKVALERVQKASGKIDLAVILQGMFAPLNRAHVANSDLGSSLNDRYQEILNYIDQSEHFMEQEHRQDYLTYYPSTIIDQVRSECLRVININKAKNLAAAHEEQEKAAEAYRQAFEYYRQKDYVNAFNAGNYRDVVFTYYPQAIQGGYQRNNLLYNNTRRALRQLMRDDPSLANWRQMQALYHERIKNLGSDDYDYRNNLETTSWCEEQLL